jgi:hypothetical protein
LALESIVDGEGAATESQRRAAFLGSSFRLTPEENLLVEVMLGQEDAPINSEPNPFDPHLINTSQIFKPVTATSMTSSTTQPSKSMSDALHFGSRPGSVSSALCEVNDAATCMADLPLSSHAAELLKDAPCTQWNQQGNEQQVVGNSWAIKCEPEVDRAASQTAEEAKGISSFSGESRQSIRSLAEIDAQLMDLALDHTWDEQCSLADFSGRGSTTTNSLRTSIAKTMQRMLFAGPLSTSSFSGSRGNLAGPASETESDASSCGRSTATSGLLSSGMLAMQGHNCKGLRHLPAIPERKAVSANGSAANGSETMCSALETASVQSQHSRRSSKHDKTDYLRPMREQRELDRLCVLPAFLFLQNYVNLLLCKN